jgi:hypothetical protein
MGTTKTGKPRRNATRKATRVAPSGAGQRSARPRPSTLSTTRDDDDEQVSPEMQRFKACLAELRRAADAVPPEQFAGYAMVLELEQLATSLRPEEVDERGWPEKTKRFVENYVDVELGTRLAHLRHSEMISARFKITAELFDRPFDGVWWHTNRLQWLREVAERVARSRHDFSLSREIGNVFELHKELTARADLEGHVANVLRALKIALDNIEQTAPRKFIKSQRQAAADFLGVADPNWRGLEVVKILAEGKATVNANGLNDPKETEAFLRRYFKLKMEAGRKVSKSSVSNDWAAGVAAFLRTTCVGVLDEAHSRMSLGELKEEICDALTKLGEKKRDDTDAMARAVMNRVGYKGPFYVSDADRQRKKLERQRKKSERDEAQREQPTEVDAEPKV